MNKVIIFGTGDYYQTKEDSIKKTYEVIGYIDNKIKNNQIGKFNSLDVMNPTDVNGIDEEAYVLIASGKIVEMYQQLHAIGVNDARIIIGTNFSPAYDAIEKKLQQKDCMIRGQDGAIIITIDKEEVCFVEENDYKKWLRKFMLDDDPVAQMIKNAPHTPVSRRFGAEMGTPIDRIYIQKFLRENEECICGDIVEIGDLRYTREYGHDIHSAYAMHVDGWGNNTIKGNLETGEGIVEATVDCLICTQTIQHISDTTACIKNIWKMLKPSGTALITNGFLTEISLYSYKNWGEFWRFSDQGIKNWLEREFKAENISVCAYGNVKTAMAFFYGLCAEELSKEDFDINDQQYQITVCAKVIK